MGRRCPFSFSSIWVLVAWIGQLCFLREYQVWAFHASVSLKHASTRNGQHHRMTRSDRDDRPFNSNNNNLKDNNVNQEIQSTNRRSFLVSTTLGVWVGAPLAGLAATASSPRYGSSPDSPVAVIGANGRTGMEVVQALAKQGFYTVTLTRTGNDPFRLVKLPSDLQPLVQHYPIPVTMPSETSLQEAIQATHASAIVYCASASKQGGTAFQVDEDGVAIAAKVAALPSNPARRLVVLSALAVDRPDSKSFQITNTIGGNYNGIMDAKRRGEERVRQTMSNYIILRPGVLLSGKGSGNPQDLELNQGDTIGGGLSRDELAQLVVAALQTSQSGITVEAYRKKTATKLQPEFAIPSGLEATADTYVGLFAKLKPDEKGQPPLL